jgi:hypothetical protein
MNVNIATLKTVASAFAFSACASFAFAADSIGTLRDVQGSVMVQSGKAFRPATSGMALFAGDKVLTMNGGVASMTVTKDNCALTMKPNQMVLVRAMPCAKLTASIEGMGLGQTETIGGLGGISTGALVAGGVVVVAGGLIVAQEQQDRKKASPN